ncbi:N-acetylmuramoyl-L-alanine amidase [Verrucomicrobiota bacterium]
MSRSAGSRYDTYKNRWHTLTFEHDSRKCTIDGVSVWLLHPVRKVMGSWAIYERDFTRTIDPVLRPATYLRNAPTSLVMLDPGHGGKDDGAKGVRNVKERLVVMDVAKRVERELRKHGIRVKKTRPRDVYLSLTERAAIAARAGASLFVSIHMNSSGDKSVAGSETYVLAPTGEDSTNHYGQKARKTACRGNRHDSANMLLGYRIQRALLRSAKRPDRGVKRARFKVLKDAPCPAALVEGAFVSNAAEESKMIEANFREAMAQGIATGIREYLSLAKKSR